MPATEHLEPWHGTTAEKTVIAGLAQGEGTEATYTGLHTGPGEPYVRRLDLAAGSPSGHHPRSLICFAQITDIHVQDHQSPGRFEFVNRFYGPAPMHLLAPAYRPQEFLQLYAVEAMVRALNRVGASPWTGAPLQFVICTGDHVDNAQHNELRWALSLFEGGNVDPRSGGSRYQGVASPDWDDAAYWHPDDVSDEYKRRWGFPAYPGLLAEAYQCFSAEGIRVPWLSCLGNHDLLIQGTALYTEAFKRLVTGAEKPRALPEGFDLIGHMGEYIESPEIFAAGPKQTVTADPSRASLDRADVLRMLYETRGLPTGHGLELRNVEAQTAYYVEDSHPGIRLIVLDTVNSGGNYDGSVGAAQMSWLENRLIEVHHRYYDATEEAVSQPVQDRLVIIFSHHGLDSLINDMTTSHGDPDTPRMLAPQVESALHRFPNIVLWVNGHTHFNTVRPRPDPSGRTQGFWEVTTVSLLDWPSQARLVEMTDNGDGTISLFCTMVDSVAPPSPGDADGLDRLASVHRELAANDPHAGIGSGHSGTVGDRNVELVLPAPFPLR